MCRAVLVLLSFFCLAAPASAAERLLVPRLDGWRAVVDHAGPAGEAAELIPEGETPETWTSRVTVQAFRGAPTKVADFLETAARAVARDCRHPWAEPPRLGRLDGAEAGSRLTGCGHLESSAEGLTSMFYALRGREAFYVISRTWRGPPYGSGAHPVPEAKLAAWIATLRAVRLSERQP